MTRGLESPELIVYGGSFDPPHAGHAGCAEQVLRRFPAARLLVTPAPAPAGLGGVAKAPVASFAHRVELCRRAFAPLGSRVEVSLLEAELPAPNYTVQTLRRLAGSFGRRLGLLMGQDQLEGFASWREPREILGLAALVVVPRGQPPEGSGFFLNPPSPRDALRQAVGNLAERLGSGFDWHDAEQAGLLLGGRGQIFVLARPVGAEASRIIRQRLAAGLAPPEGWLTPALSQYLLDHELYGSVGKRIP